MAINKVVYGNNTLMDITDTTASTSDVASGEVFYTADGTRSTGTAQYIEGLTILRYGISTWADFIEAYNKQVVVYCRASSNANPASGTQTRLAFMAYVNNAENPTNVEFQYYRSVNAHSASQQGDQVYVYKLDKNSGWSVTVREAYTKIVAGTGLSSSYSNGTMTLTSSGGSSTDVQINGTSIVSSGTANIVTNTAYNASSNKIATMSDISSSLGSYVEKSSSSQNESGLTGWDYDGGLIYETRLQGNYGDGYVTIYPNEVEIGSANSFVSLNDGSCSLGGSSGITLNNDTYIYGGLIAGTTGDGDVTLHGLVAPTANDDPATKKYVDDICGNIETLLGGI